MKKKKKTECDAGVKMLICSEDIKQVCMISYVRKSVPNFQNMLNFMPIVYILCSRVCV